MKLGPFDLPGFAVGDCRELLRQLPDASVQCVVTSPPYWALRDYGVDGQIGMEATPEAFVLELVAVFREVRRALRDDGTLWLNLGDCYAGSGRGGYVGQKSTLDGSSTHMEETAKARKKRGSQKPAGFHQYACEAGVTARAWTKPPPGLKNKDLVGIPWMVAFALRADGWYLRADVIWSKPNPMPEPVDDRPTKAHEYLFLLSKSTDYVYNADAIRDPLRPKTLTTFGSERRSKGNDAGGGVKADNWARDVRVRRAKVGDDGEPVGANKRSVWTIATQPVAEAHFATFPEKLVEPCILAGSRPGDVVLDPFFGSGTVGRVAEKHGRLWLGFDISAAYAEIAGRRTAQRSLPGTATR